MIELTKNVYWDPEADHQTVEAVSWVADNIMQTLPMNVPTIKKTRAVAALSSSEPVSVNIEKDEFERPVRWTIVYPTYTAIIVREYIKPNTWAKRKDNISIIAND